MITKKQEREIADTRRRLNEAQRIVRGGDEIGAICDLLKEVDRLKKKSAAQSRAFDSLAEPCMQALRYLEDPAKFESVAKLASNGNRSWAQELAGQLRAQFPAEWLCREEPIS